MDVRQRIKVGVGDAVWDDAISVGADLDHAVLERIGVVDGFLGVRFAGERDGDPLVYKTRRPAAASRA